MFSKTSKGSAGSADGPKKPATPSIISCDLRIIGDINSEGEVQIDGAVEGDIRSHILLVGETATIKGEIVADKVNVHGTVIGQIKARAVDLAKSARVTGDILHEDLSIEAGAFLEGMCKRIPMKEVDENTINLVIKEGDKLSANGPSSDVSNDVKKVVTGG